ncbi:uncharacterized protein MELLADRAFT_107956 [Melampsora larici-populina 98AG31]|uniref:Tet-like 2OG-Fe(II) oxygenase domain-containing protein n=1 Tax=Melampsora larici-populina (strain 98AG31 / pathotype 3-4-7) TaxID=747676 RepID=F4RRH9_MELLP|nr:uncharacterized protein MELLADRAFT_107956 [Melampsora larici-populina 98AG31]EGG04937.1 hypothetical protein MELLADRAFT_107956 [Melampsora larici-populina 98AG31]
MEADLKRQGNLPQIESFFAEQFSGLLLSAFESNATIAARVQAPSWGNDSFYVSPNAKVFGSNITVTFDKFANKKHKDRDASKYAFGFFGLVDGLTALVDRIDKVRCLCAEMGEEDWISYKSSVLTGYKEQAHKKMKALAVKLGIWRDDF